MVIDHAHLGDDSDRSVAVIGMACRLPGASAPDALWELLSSGAEAVTTTPPDRYDAEELHASASTPGSIASREAGFADGIADFDASFFGMSAAEAVELDPQQRLLLMTAWEALEDAGQPPSALAGTRSGVFVGNSRADHLENALRQGFAGITAGQYNNVRTMLAARLSHVFDLHGPSVVVDTACSSSLVAVHQAVQSIRTGESRIALVAAANLPLRPDEGVMMTRAGTMSGDGRSRFGAADADGHAPSDAVGVVVLKPLKAALADGDRVRAVVAGSAIGNDGRGAGTLLNPSQQGQREVLRWAYEDAGIAPSGVDYVEAHGAGSPLLDPIELNALGDLLGEGRTTPLLVGSVKSNIGHAEAAGGLAGLIKAVLCLEHRSVPASLHASTPNPQVPWEREALEIPARTRELSGEGAAVIGVSAQGVSAHNAHVVLRSPDPVEAPATDVGGSHLLPLSARTPQALADLTAAYAEFLAGAGREHTVRDICAAAALRRDHLSHRLVVAGSTHEELADALVSCRSAELTPFAARYLRDGSVDWAELFGERTRHVPLPTYRWQTRRYWPGEQHGDDDLADRLLGMHARSGFDADSVLTDIGIDSLAKLKLLVEIQQHTGKQVDAELIGCLRTVGELHQWVRQVDGAVR